MYYPEVDEYEVPSEAMQVPPPLQQSPHNPNVNAFTVQSASMQVPHPLQQSRHDPNVNAFTVQSAPMQVPPPPLLPEHYPKVDKFAGQPPPLPPRQHVVIGVPPMQYRAPGTWTTGIFDCFDDIDSCCLVFCCPSVAFGRIAHITSKGLNSCVGSAFIWCCLLQLGLQLTGIGWQWIYSTSSRSNLRAQFNLPEDPCCDCGVHFFCEPCSFCQMYRELQNRGYDMSIGYQQNLENFSRVNLQPPQVPGAMIR